MLTGLLFLKFFNVKFCFHVSQDLAKDIREMAEKMGKNKHVFSQVFRENADNKDVIEETLDCLQQRLLLLETVVNHRCQQMKERFQQILNFQVRNFTCKFLLVHCRGKCN